MPPRAAGLVPGQPHLQLHIGEVDGEVHHALEQGMIAAEGELEGVVALHLPDDVLDASTPVVELGVELRLPPRQCTSIRLLVLHKYVPAHVCMYIGEVGEESSHACKVYFIGQFSHEESINASFRQQF